MREGDRLQEIERERAKARQGTRTDLNIPENLPECSGGQSRDIAAKKLGMSGKITTIDAVQAAREMPLAMPGAPDGTVNNPDGIGGKAGKVKVDKVYNVNVIKEPKGGNRKEYLLRRLARDHPEALDRIQSGEISTRKAAIEYGIIKVKTPMQIIMVEVGKLGSAWCAYPNFRGTNADPLILGGSN